MQSFIAGKVLATSVREAFAYALVGAVTLYLCFILFEPVVTRGQASDQFEVSLDVTGETAFVVGPNNVTLSPSISGITGGTANGATQVRVRTNNTLGYQMTLQASSSAGMIGDTSGNVIPAYTLTATTTPEYTFTTPANSARFGYTVNASTTGDMVLGFLDNGSVCGAGTNNTVGTCWLNASTTPVVIINRGTSTDVNGATTTISFRAQITSNPSPSIAEDTYTATTTLTITNN